MVVVGSMIGSGIFIVSADMARQVGSPAGCSTAWLVTGVLTVAAALSYGELAAMMPRAGGQYVYLREAFSPLWGFLYGWTLFLVIQTGTIAAVAVAFARFLGVLVARGSRKTLPDRARFTCPRATPCRSRRRSSSAMLLIALLTWTNTRGLEYGRIVQNVFTTAKTGALIALIVVGLVFGWNADAVAAQLRRPLDAARPGRHRARPDAPRRLSASSSGCASSQTGSLFSADAWNNITFTAGEVKDPRRNVPLSLALGTGLVIALYLLANVAYLVTLPLDAIQHAPVDRVATATLERMSPALGADADGGRDHDFHVWLQQRTDSRRRARLLRDGARRALLPPVGELNAGEGAGRGASCFRACGRCCWCCRGPTTRQPAATAICTATCSTTSISAALIFYILTIAGVFRLRAHRPDCRTSLPGLRLSRGASSVHRRRGDAAARALRVSPVDDLAGPRDRAARRAGVFRVAQEGLTTCD